MMRSGRRASKEPWGRKKKRGIALIGFLMIPYFSLLHFFFQGKKPYNRKVNLTIHFKLLKAPLQDLLC